MTPSRLREWLDGTRKRVLWLEYDAYARHVFANGAADWWSQSTRYATTMIQARRAIKTEVVTQDIAAPGFAIAPRGNDPLASCKLALQDPAGVRFIDDSVDALVHQLGGHVDLVLRVAVPLDLLRQVGAESAPSFDDLDEISAAIVAIVRHCAEKPIAGLLLTRNLDLPLTTDEQEAYAPLLHAAKHYGWVTCVQTTESVIQRSAADWSDIDIVLCEDFSHAQLAASNSTGNKFGGGLPKPTWAQPAAALAASDALWFGTIPPQAKPEFVLARCASLGLTP